ncbi:unnamed protein product [Agarophyton chilense]
MPSASRAEALVGVQEVHDRPLPDAIPALPDALSARAHLLQKFPPLGPPDMVYLRKRYVPVVGAEKIYGYYHFVRGAHPRGLAAVSAYIVDIVRNSGLDPLPWVSAGAWQIVSATFVAYDVLSRVDVCVHVDFPGSTTASALDATGAAVALSDALWHQLLVSSVVRDMAAVGEQPLYPCLRVISPPSLGVDAAFRTAAVHTAPRWHLAPSPHTSDPQPLSPAPTPASSPIAFIIRHHFLSSALFETAIQFFTDEQLCAADPDFIVHAATAARLARDLPRADALVQRVLDANPHSHLACTERANILRANAQLQPALNAAHTAALSANHDLDVCLLLADIHVDLKQHAKAFQFLNEFDVQTPPLDPFLRHLIPNRRNLTKPSDGALSAPDAVRVLADRLREEKQLSTDKTDYALHELPAKMMTQAEEKCYAVLVKILNDLSWDQMLAVRGQCFVMEKDIEDGHLSMSDDEEQQQQQQQQQDDHDEHLQQNQPQNSVEEAPGHEVEAEHISQRITTISLSEDDDERDRDRDHGGADVDAHADDAHADDADADDDDDEEQEQYDEHTPQQQNGDVDSVEARKRTLEKTGKKVCKPWLDYLVTNMYHDLKAMAMWNAEEQQHSTESSFPTSSATSDVDADHAAAAAAAVAATRDVEAQESEHTFQRTADEIVKETKRPYADWMRRGELALRLGKPEEAKVAFWACLKLAEKEKVVCVTSLCRLIEQGADDGDVKTTIKCVDTLWGYLDSMTKKKDNSEPSAAVPVVQKSVFRLISNKGLRAVREAVSAALDVNRKRFEGLLLDAVALRVDGFLR